MQQAIYIYLHIIEERLNWLRSFIYVVKLDKDKIEEKKKCRELWRTCARDEWEIKKERKNKETRRFDSNNNNNSSSNKDTQESRRLKRDMEIDLIRSN